MCYFFFNDTATTEIYTLSLHDALPILGGKPSLGRKCGKRPGHGDRPHRAVSGRHILPGVSNCRLGRPSHSPHALRDRKSTRLNSSHANISYAVFCLKKKKIKYKHINSD